LLPWLEKLKNKNIKIYDPCCGTYAIGNFLRDNGYTNIVETDLYTTPIKTDFLKTKVSTCDLMIANIPFCVKYQFFKRAFLLGKHSMSSFAYLFNFFL
jgi:type I restriction-modification system DNA methylase subunit